MPEKCCAFLSTIGYLHAVQEEMEESDRRMLAIPEGDVSQMAEFCEETSKLFNDLAIGFRTLVSVCED